MSDEALQSDYLNAMGIQRWVPRRVSASNTDSGATIWQTLQTKVSNCHACRLSETRTQTVFGVGSQQADLLIVGEAPGFYEDKQGEPFVGRAGQLLNALFLAIGLTREQVYIANVLKCRPPNNRDPLGTEVAQCTPFLAEQITLLQPKLILAVGRYAAHYLLGSNESLARLRNTTHVFEQTQTPLIVSYHPAYLLRNPIDKRKALLDWYQVREMLK